MTLHKLLYTMHKRTRLFPRALFLRSVLVIRISSLCKSVYVLRYFVVSRIFITNTKNVPVQATHRAEFGAPDTRSRLNFVCDEFFISLSLSLSLSLPQKDSTKISKISIFCFFVSKKLEPDKKRRRCVN